MAFIKRAEKKNYSVLEVHQTTTTVFKSIRFHFDNIFFGVFDDLIRHAKSDFYRYRILCSIYQHLTKMGFYPPGSKIKVRGTRDPLMLVQMPIVTILATELPLLKIQLAEKYLHLPQLFYDVYHIHNYHEYQGKTYFIDLELFPKK